MSKVEIMQELPKLGPEERQEILQRLWDLEEQDLARGPSDAEKALLDRELEEYQCAPDAGAPWSEVKGRLKKPQ